MPLRPCLDCGQLTRSGSRCPAHARARDRARGSSGARGYGPDHQAARRALEQTLPAPCGYGCGQVLEPGSSWVAAHLVDGDPSAGWIASCRSCNELAKTPR